MIVFSSNKCLLVAFEFSGHKNDLKGLYKSHAGLNFFCASHPQASSVYFFLTTAHILFGLPPELEGSLHTESQMQRAFALKASPCTRLFRQSRNCPGVQYQLFTLGKTSFPLLPCSFCPWVFICV